MVQGKLISFSPKMVNGVQETYAGTNGLLYIFDTVFEINGTQDMGKCNSKSTTPPWKIGDVYSFERKVSGAQGQYINYSKLENVSNPKPAYTGGSGGGTKGGGLTFAKQKARECSYHAGVTFWCSGENKHGLTDINYSAPANAFYNAIVSTGLEADIWLNIAALNALVEKVDRVQDLLKPEDYKGHTIDYWIEEMGKMRKDFESLLK